MDVHNIINKVGNNTRSGIAKKNIIASIFIKGCSVLVNLLYVPLLIKTLGKTEYGIWLILSSLVGWFSYFDIGIGNGLRNKFAEAVSQGDYRLARIFVSTAYAVVSIIFIIVGMIGIIIIPLLNWNSILNTNDISNSELISIVLIVFSFFIIRFITQLIAVILLADQKTALSSSLSLIANIVTLVVIFILNKLSLATLLVSSFILSSVPVLVFILSSFYFFTKDYKRYKPSIYFINFSYNKQLFRLGIQFFIIQLSMIIFYSSTNLLITQFFSPDDVAVYNIGFKYFSLITMIFGIILAPMWSAITEAYAVKDYEWIKKVMKKLKIAALLLCLLVFFMLLFANKFYELWVGKIILIPIKLSAVLALTTIVYIFFSPYSIFLNGVSKIKLNTYLVILQSVLYIPVAYLLAKYYNMGISGIILAGLLCELPLRITQPLQYKLIMENRAYGIWNK
ncbi:MAG: MATE family efflux transporter [Ignavibacteriaceae bacterium]|nr:MATE family efflux transporter [Ignavibacteriaceae bacterium]